MDPIQEILVRGVDTIYPSKQALEKILQTGKKLRLFQGFDPTGTHLHIGHMTGLMKLRQFQKAGHEVIFLVGDGTGQAGDPSGKSRSRDRFFKQDELRENAKNYVMQAGRIVKFDGKNPAKILYNGDWLNKLDLPKLLDIAGNFSLQQLEERDLFQERRKKGEPINMREFLYPLLQGYDSVVMDVDLEIGGTDQTFNMLCGRTLVKNYLNKEKFVLTTPLLTDSSGRKIGKTEGNVIAITAKPEELYGMIMSLGDDIVVKSFEYLTEVTMAKIRDIQKRIQRGESPMLFKKQLAHEIVGLLNGTSAAKKAQEYFERTVQKKELPDTIPTISMKTSSSSLLDLLVKTRLAASRSDAKRLVRQGGVEIDGKKVTDSSTTIAVKDGMILKAGKRRFVKINR